MGVKDLFVCLLVCLFFFFVFFCLVSLILLTNQTDGLVEMDFAGLFPGAPPVVEF